MTMRYWKVTLACYTPVFIGSGDIYKKSQYIYDKNSKMVYFLREDKWVSFLGKHGILDDFARELMKNPSRFNLFSYLINQPVLKKRYGYFSDIKKAMEASGAIARGEDYLAVGGEDGRKGPNDIAAFILDVEGNPYIPGSSLKGAFRTAILSHVIRKNRGYYSNEWKEIERAAGRKVEMGKAMDRLERKLALAPDKDGNLDMVNSYFRGLTVSDATLVDGELCVVPKTDLTIHDDDTHQVSLYREALASDSSLEFTIGIDDDPKGMGRFGIHTFKELQDVLKEFVHFQYEILKKPFLENADFELEDIKNAKNADMLLGGGTGFLSKTLVYSLAPDRNSAVKVTKKLMEASFKNGKHSGDREISPHTLKLVDEEGDTRLMGCCWMRGKPLC